MEIGLMKVLLCKMLQHVCVYFNRTISLKPGIFLSIQGSYTRNWCIIISNSYKILAY